MHVLHAASVCVLLLGAARTVAAQVSPAEILNPKLRAIEAKYLQQLKALHEDIGAAKFPFPFVLSRYVGVDPARQAAMDSRGLEFSYFQNRLLLKVTGNYNAAYNADKLTQNERASRTFQDVVTPLLQLIVREIPADVECDGIGFEIGFHTRTPNKSFDYEGKEILVVVLDRADAFSFTSIGGTEQQQDILNRSQIYLNGKEYGLALGQADPLNVEALARSVPAQPVAAPISPAEAANAAARLAVTNPNLAPTISASKAHMATGVAPTAPTAPDPAPATSVTSPAADAKPPATAADADRLQEKFQPQLEALAKKEGTKFHLVGYAAPSFTLYHNQIVLQLTLRNPQPFVKSSSIYKRAAQSFDLFLAPQLKGLLEKLPTGADFDGLDITVLNQIGIEKNASEAVEYICPMKALRSFANDEITTQELINRSIVLVNGARIALNLQLVE
jgi:hypothetical protein